MLTWLRGLGRKGQLLLVCYGALIAVGVVDRAAAAEIGWCLVAAYGVFAGANTGVHIGMKPKAPPAEEQEGS